MSDDIRDRIAAQLASPQWALMRRSDNIEDHRDDTGPAYLTVPGQFDNRFPQYIQTEKPTRLGVDAGALDLDRRTRRP